MTDNRFALYDTVITCDKECCGGEFPKGTRGVIISTDATGHYLVESSESKESWWHCKNCLLPEGIALMDQTFDNLSYAVKYLQDLIAATGHLSNQKGTFQVTIKFFPDEEL